MILTRNLSRSPCFKAIISCKNVRALSSSQSRAGMSSPFKSSLVTPAELAAALESQPPPIELPKTSEKRRVVPLCASWFLPNDLEKRTGAQAFARDRIPYARFFDIDSIKDHESKYPHMLPTTQDFASAMSELGIRKEDAVVVYDTAELGIFSAPRVAWTFRVFGHDQVHVLNNYRLWKEGGYSIETSPIEEKQRWEKTKYPIPQFRSEKVITFREIRDINRKKYKGEHERAQVIDLRSEGRFEGTMPEPRPGIPSGHMPGSINIPLPKLLDPKTGAYLSKESLRDVFTSHGIDPKGPVVTTCGTGVMAAACDLAMKEAGIAQPDERRCYDGSWTEYAERASNEEGMIIKSKG